MSIDTAEYLAWYRVRIIGCGSLPGQDTPTSSIYYPQYGPLAGITIRYHWTGNAITSRICLTAELDTGPITATTSKAGYHPIMPLPTLIQSWQQIVKTVPHIKSDDTIHAVASPPTTDAA